MSSRSMKQFAPLVLLLCMLPLVGCQRAPQEYDLKTEELVSFELGDPTGGNFDWPVSPSGFAIRRPPIYSSLVGLKNEPFDEIDQVERAEEERLEGDKWAKFLRAVGNQPYHAVSNETDSLGTRDCLGPR